MSKRYTYRLGAVISIVLITLALLWLAILGGLWFAYDNYEQFRLEREDELIYGGVILGFVLLHFGYLIWKNKAIQRFAETGLMKHSLSPISSFKSIVKLTLFYSAASFMFLAYLNPQFGTKEKTSEVKGIDLIVALDVSNSMLARDLDENKTRLDIAKRSIEGLTSKLHGDRFGIVVFAGKAFTQLPTTTDYSAAKLFISTISTDLINTQGTAIGNAIEVALNSFDFESNTKKAIIIVSDGENHEDNAIEMAQEAAEKGVIIHTVGLGSTNGVPIPMYQNGRFINNKRDNNGNTVLTKLNEDMLKELAAIGNGAYVKAERHNLGLDLLLNKLSNLEKEAYDTKQYLEYEDQFQWFLLFGLLLFVPSIMISETLKQEQN